ncbi:MAG: M28 family peptidase [Polyangiaceae bacterium]|nr:M28 family peptidase [Polyangiaceae bacterium]
MSPTTPRPLVPLVFLLALGSVIGACAATPSAPPANPPPVTTSSPPPAAVTPPPLTPRESALVPELGRIVGHLAGTIGERNPSRKWQFADAIDYVALELEAAGLSVDRQGYELNGEVVAQNLVTEVRGDLRREEILVVGAHLDSAEGSPGAGAATGVAALIALAKGLRTSRPARSVRFAVFSLCEGPQAETDVAGSRVYARRAAARGERLVAAIALDSLGHFSASGPQGRSSELAADWPDVGDFLALIAAPRDQELLDQAATAFASSASLPSAIAIAAGPTTSLGPSDAWGFGVEGIPTVRITDTARLRDPDLGSPRDLPDRIAHEQLARVVAGLERMVLDLAGRNEPSGGLVTDPTTGRLRPPLDGPP